MVIEAGPVGTVRLIFREPKAERGNFSHWFWQSKGAYKAQGLAPQRLLGRKDFQFDGSHLWKPILIVYLIC